MCRQCIPINKNKDCQMKDVKSRNKETVSEEHEKMLNRNSSFFT